MSRSVIYLCLIFAFWLYCKIARKPNDETKMNDGDVSNGEFGVDDVNGTAKDGYYNDGFTTNPILPTSSKYKSNTINNGRYKL